MTEEERSRSENRKLLSFGTSERVKARVAASIYVGVIDSRSRVPTKRHHEARYAGPGSIGICPRKLHRPVPICAHPQPGKPSSMLFTQEPGAASRHLRSIPGSVPILAGVEDFLSIVHHHPTKARSIGQYKAGLFLASGSFPVLS